MEYLRTKDILHVKQVLGHKNIKNTEVNTHLITFPENDEYIVKAFTNHTKAIEFLEKGFTYELTTPDGIMLFKKRK